MNITKENIYGYIGSLVFCVIILLILWISVLKTIIPTEEEGILLNFGDINEASGMFEPRNMEDNNNIPVEPATPEIFPQAPAPEVAITQNIEQTASVDAENKKKEEEQKRLAEVERKRKEEEQKRQQAINNQVAGAFSTGNTQSQGQGTGTTGQGIQGSSQANSNSGAGSGVDGYGDFSLTGRSLGPGGLPRPAYSIQEEGLIVIDITVNKNGNVILATIGKGTNIDNKTMRESALEAAKKTKFNAISGNEDQSGKITYKYYLR